MSRYTVVITGASGSVYGLRLIEQLLIRDNEVAACFTDAGRDVCAYETGFDLPEKEAAKAISRFLEIPAEAHKLRCVSPSDLFDPIASGSHRVDGMVVCPASMGFVSKVANGLSSDLPSRAADVALKERTPLIVVPRETPLSLVHLRNLTALAEAGAVVLPAMPGFYQRPRTLDDSVNFVVGKVLDSLGIDHELFSRWGE
ncbi:MAG: UbiX family flavin prenyltransferase [Actinobacteria bacterium]|nr:UbiX family flavin prenyltransferase [Actinomycetota bacterium]MCL5888226.1 UbiX family flavin prenyltransferase [Actinomycetota bacterium]